MNQLWSLGVRAAVLWGITAAAGKMHSLGDLPNPKLWKKQSCTTRSTLPLLQEMYHPGREELTLHHILHMMNKGTLQEDASCSNGTWYSCLMVSVGLWCGSRLEKRLWKPAWMAPPGRSGRPDVLLLGRSLSDSIFPICKAQCHKTKEVL